MKQSNQQSEKLHLGSLAVSRKLLVLLCIGIVAIPIAFYLYNYSALSPRNYAAEVARPLEDGLVRAGAKSVCVTGSSGRGVDNTSPWHTAVFLLPKDRPQTESLIGTASSDNGFHLTHADLANRGSNFSIDDKYISNLYFDETNRVSNYSDLESGAIKLSIALGNERREYSNISCGTNESPVAAGDSEHTVVTVGIELPSFRR